MSFPMCGRLTSCSIRFTLNRCDLANVAQGYQAVLRIHLPSAGLAWNKLNQTNSVPCLHSSATLYWVQQYEQALVGFDPVRRS